MSASRTRKKALNAALVPMLLSPKEGALKAFVAQKEQAAQAAGIAVPTLTNLKNSSKWRSTTLCALAHVLEIHPFDLLSDTGFPPPHVGAPAMALNGN